MGFRATFANEPRPIWLRLIALGLVWPSFYLLIAISSTPAPDFPLITGRQPDINTTDNIFQAFADSALGDFRLAIGWRELCAQGTNGIDGSLGAWVCTSHWHPPHEFGPQREHIFPQVL